MRERGVRCLVYLDDWAFFPDTDEQALEWQQIAAEVWDSLGLMKQPGKGTVGKAECCSTSSEPRLRPKSIHGHGITGPRLGQR